MEQIENIICEFCNKTFKNKSSLLVHQKTAKYCLEKQGLKIEYKCDHCSKILSSNKRLLTHIDICKLKVKNELFMYKSLCENKNKKEYKDLLNQKEREYKDLLNQKEREYKGLLNQKEREYKDLLNQKEQEYKALLNQKDREIIIYKDLLNQKDQDLKNQLLTANNTIAEIAKQPKTVSNNDNRIKTQNNIQQSFDINDVKRISNILEDHLTPDVLANGQKGLADMLKKHLLQNDKGEPIYECTDVSRQKFEFVNKHGFIESDPKAAKLITSLNNANIFDVAHSTGKKLWETDNGVNHDSQTVHMPKVTEVLDIKDDSSKFRSHLASITSR